MNRKVSLLLSFIGIFSNSELVSSTSPTAVDRVNSHAESLERVSSINYSRAIKAASEGMKSDNPSERFAALNLFKTLTEKGQGIKEAIEAASEGMKSDDLNERSAAEELKSLSTDFMLNTYMNSKFMKSIYHPDIVSSIKEGIRDYVKEEGKWPEDIETKEYFYYHLNLLLNSANDKPLEGPESHAHIDMELLPNSHHLSCIKKLFSSPHKIEWKAFKDFSYNNYSFDVSDDRYRLCMSNILLTFLTFPMETETFAEYMVARDEFSKNYNISEEGYDQTFADKIFLEIFLALPTKQEREEFYNYHKNSSALKLSFYYQYNDAIIKTIGIKTAFYAFKNEEMRKELISFFETYLRSKRPQDVILIMGDLLKAYQEFSTKEDREAYIEFADSLCLWGGPYPIIIQPCTEYLLSIFHKISNNERAKKSFEDLVYCQLFNTNILYIPKKVLMRIPIFSAFSTEEERDAFMKFCRDLYPEITEPSTLTNLIPVFKSFESDKTRNEFMEFCKSIYSESVSPQQTRYLVPVFKDLSEKNEIECYIEYIKSAGIMVDKTSKYPVDHVLYEAFKNRAQ